MRTQSKPSKFSLPLLRRRAEEEAAGLAALMTRAEQAAHTIMTGEHARRKPGTGEKFWQFREYQAGDRPQDIDWRQSAKTDRVFIRQKEWQTAQTALFWCASGPGMDYKSAPALPTKHEAAATLALALAILMTRAGERAGLLAGGLTPGRSDLALQKIGRAFLSGDGGAFPATALPPRNAGLVLTGDFLDPLPELEAVLAPLAERCPDAQLVQVLDPAELSLPFAGRVIFEQPGNLDERHHVANAESVRAAYKRRMEEHIGGVKALCRRYRWNWLLHRTDAPVRETLHDAWMMIAPGGRA